MSSMAWDAYEAGITPEFGGEPADWIYRDDPPHNAPGSGEFSTFEEAKQWAKSNPGKAITRSPDGNGYIVKKKQSCPVRKLHVPF